MSNSNTASTDTAQPGTTGETFEPIEVSLAVLRKFIDELDDKIISAILTRKALSEGVQELKIQAGLPRTDLARESEVIKRYIDELDGPHGSTIAHHILMLSKD